MPTDQPCQITKSAATPCKKVFRENGFSKSRPFSPPITELCQPRRTPTTSPLLWLPPPSATPKEWTTTVLRGHGHLTAATTDLRARKPKGTTENSPVSFSRVPEVGTPCGHVYAARRKPPVTYVVLEVFEVRVRRAESLWMEPGEPEADGPKGGCLQGTPDITNASPGPATQLNI